jgi:hypothetical protein
MAQSRGLTAAGRCDAQPHDQQNNKWKKAGEKSEGEFRRDRKYEEQSDIVAFAFRGSACYDWPE